MNKTLLTIALTVALVGSVAGKSFADTNSSSAWFGSDAITTGDISGSGNYADNSDNATNIHDFANNNDLSTNVGVLYDAYNGNTYAAATVDTTVGLTDSFNYSVTDSTIGDGNATFTNVGAGINGGAADANVSSSQNALVTGGNINENVNGALPTP